MTYSLIDLVTANVIASFDHFLDLEEAVEEMKDPSELFVLATRADGSVFTFEIEDIF